MECRRNFQPPRSSTLSSTRPRDSKSLPAPAHEALKPTHPASRGTKGHTATPRSTDTARRDGRISRRNAQEADPNTAKFAVRGSANRGYVSPMDAFARIHGPEWVTHYSFTYAILGRPNYPTRVPDGRSNPPTFGTQSRATRGRSTSRTSPWGSTLLSPTRISRGRSNSPTRGTPARGTLDRSSLPTRALPTIPSPTSRHLATLSDQPSRTTSSSSVPPQSAFAKRLVNLPTVFP